MALKKIFKSYHFGLNYDLQAKDLSTLIELFGNQKTQTNGILGGRGSVSKATLSQTGPVIIKYYRRGGMIRHIIRSHYLKLGKTRPELEFDMLKKASMLNIPVPAPVAWAYKTKAGLFYQGWLITKEIANQKSLADISKEETDRLVCLLKKTASLIALLINSGIFHVDLHPGNVLVNDDNKIFLVDFDKAMISGATKTRLKHLYLTRWNRAVTKHNLPEVLSTIMDKELLIHLP